MDYQIKELMKQGLSRNEIFEQLRKQSGNQMRLANKIATFEPGSSSRRTVLLNRVLLALCLLQACFGIWVIYSNVVPMDEEFGWQGIVATFIFTIFYFFGLLSSSLRYQLRLQNVGLTTATSVTGLPCASNNLTDAG